MIGKTIKPFISSSAVTEQVCINLDLCGVVAMLVKNYTPTTTIVVNGLRIHMIKLTMPTVERAATLYGNQWTLIRVQQYYKL
jgi:hypothetical protein